MQKSQEKWVGEYFCFICVDGKKGSVNISILNASVVESALGLCSLSLFDGFSLFTS